MSIASHGLEEGRDYELTIGSSFLASKAKEAYHLMRYDFKPASIDTSRPAEFLVGENNQCTVTIPNIQDSGNTTTTYRGGKKPCTKECVLIIDKETGQITLERVTSSIPLKKCRADKIRNEDEGVLPPRPSCNGSVQSSMKQFKQCKPGSSQLNKMKSEKKTIVQNKPTKDPSSLNTSKSSKPTHSNALSSSGTSSLNSAPSTTPSLASSIHNPISSTNTAASSVHSSTVSSNNSSKINTNPLNASATIPKKRLMSDMSVSSTSSDSSDSDSADEEDPLANQLESISASNPPSKSTNQPSKSLNGNHKSTNPPPSKSSNPPPKPSNPTMKPVNSHSKSVNPPPKSTNSTQKPINQLSKPANSLPKSERPPTAKMESSVKSDRSPAPAKVPPVKTKEKSFLSTLQSDLQLSDSNSDSD